MSSFDFPDSPAATPQRRPSSSMGWLLGAIAILLLVIAGAGAYFVWENVKDKRDREELDAVRLKISGVENRIGLARSEFALEVMKENSNVSQLEADRERKIAPHKEELFTLRAQEQEILSRHPDWK